MKIWINFQLTTMRWILLTLLFVLGISYLQTGNIQAFQRPKETQKPPITINYDDFSQAEIQAIQEYERLIYSRKNTEQIMRNLDRFNKDYQFACDVYSLDICLNKAVDFVESGGYEFALSYANCAGLSQFCVATAEACGLAVSDNWKDVYTKFLNAKTPQERAYWGKILAKIDWRFDPHKSIPAKAKHMRTLVDSLGSYDLATQAHHDGSPNIIETVQIYESNPKNPKFTRWSNLVQTAKQNRQSELYRLLYVVRKDRSYSYYYVVMAAYFAARDWQYDRKTFNQKVKFYRNPQFKGKIFAKITSPTVIYLKARESKSLSSNFSSLTFNLLTWKISGICFLLWLFLRWQPIRRFFFNT